MELKDFITPADHKDFLAKRLFGPCGEILDGSIAYIAPGGGGPSQMHIHQHDHLFIVVSGQITILQGTKQIELGANEALRVTGEVPHAMWNLSDQQAVVIGLSVE